MSTTTVEPVGFCHCTNEQLEAGASCEHRNCPNGGAHFDTAADTTDLEADRLRRWADEHGENGAALAWESVHGDDD